MIKKNTLKKFNVSDRLAYILIVISSFVLIGVGVYAYGGNSPLTMGHSAGEMELPPCSVGQVLDWTGSSWGCATLGDLDMRLSIVSGSGEICYTTPVSTCSLTPPVVCSTFYESEAYLDNCVSVTQVVKNSLCITRCVNHGPACDGDINSCPGGTVAEYNTVNIASCDGNSLFCKCGTTEAYSLEGYVPAGTQRCI